VRDCEHLEGGRERECKRGSERGRESGRGHWREHLAKDIQIKKILYSLISPSLSAEVSTNCLLRLSADGWRKHGERVAVYV
jgi:hypothetical protein